jgi:K+-sensing histidine kinase KdpD
MLLETKWLYGLWGMVAFRDVSFRKLIPAGSAEAYAFATLCIAVAAVVRWIVGLWFEGIVPFATFFPAVLLAALIGGIGPGLFAAIAGGTIGWWAFTAPPMVFFPLKPWSAVLPESSRSDLPRPSQRR